MVRIFDGQIQLSRRTRKNAFRTAAFGVDPDGGSPRGPLPDAFRATTEAVELGERIEDYTTAVTAQRLAAQRRCYCALTHKTAARVLATLSWLETAVDVELIRFQRHA
ncbi:hypothetical protein ACFYY2_14280 [Streptomyces sp. NPDC001822]|uniref:hypothetical protein n=1 Tax=Streptomyces sp. NPDC001822 TaxID=3364614 RepID=UPI0036C66AA3